MRQFATSIDIAAPPARVWHVMSDVERWHEWTPSVTSVTLLGGGPLAVGRRALIRQPKYPPALWKVAVLDEGRAFTWVSSAPGLRVVGHHMVDATATGGRATLSLDYQGLLGGLLGRMTRGLTERYLELEANGLKRRSENPDFRVDESS